ncbi:MAG: adenosylhomocysteinase, partial [Candidatus Thorarchaeota archaeon]|nr:adenosylhomocysteinase [Candidatus Thorarchaeota archaeon]
MMPDYKVKDIDLAEEGRSLIDYAETHMPVLMHLREKYSETKPLDGMRISGCLHVTKETAVLVETLREVGAEVAWSGCNPLSTNDKVAAALAANDVPVFAWHGLDTDDYYWCIEQTLKIKPTMTLDDGADLIFTLHNTHTELIDNLYGGAEETTTGVIRIRAMAEDGALKYPIMAVNDADTKHLFDNVYGTGQSSFDGVLRASAILIAGKTVVIGGYGYCGRGLAIRADGLGANVIVTEVDPVRALKARMDGFRVMPMIDAAPEGDLFITATGMRDVITKEHMELMKDGAILGNAGHYDVEVNKNHLENLSKTKERVRHALDAYRLKDGRTLYLLGDGRLVNLVAAEGHPSEVMDLSFAAQLNAMLWLKEHGRDLEPDVYEFPKELDKQTAKQKLKTMGIEIDEWTEEQEKYAHAYAEGT